jgi:GNAT superfamily N-acetyltransferase
MDADLVKLETPHWVNGKQRALESDGVIIEPLRPELILPSLDFLRQEFPGDWQRFARETMTQISLGIYRPDNLWVASEREAVIGYAQHDNTGRFGPFGVSKGERGRGIGAVLLLACLHAMRAKGLHNAWFLWTDDKVARLYSQAGFTESRRFAVLKKEHGQLTR